MIKHVDGDRGGVLMDGKHEGKNGQIFQAGDSLEVMVLPGRIMSSVKRRFGLKGN